MVQSSTHHERIVPRLLEQEMRESFIDYSMSVIVQRALPDARDGLKPVHRRILFAMHELGLRPDRSYKKSATVVGDVLGKYHPHGDSAVYDTLVRMAQGFSMRYPLVDPQGNFGSIDGDSAAAYRYTEARLAPIATELLADIEHETVDFSSNFDDRLREPTVLPARLPELLLNGSDGIAVGMATKIPPHNIDELLDATGHLVSHPDCPVEELMERVAGPDFPTGGYIWGRRGIERAYRTGRGRVEMRARMHVEEGNYGKKALVVTELPYQVNKSRVIDQITRQVRRGRLGAITDLRDESDRDGIRLVIELKRDSDPRRIVETLFKKTQLRYTFGVITLALVDGRPEELDLKRALECFVNHRLRVIARRAAHELEQAEDRAHVLDGLLVALEEIERVLELIRRSESPGEARERLEEELALSGRQAEAILAMRLSRLTALEGRKLEEERGRLRESIQEFRRLVEDEPYRRERLEADLRELRRRYGDPRRTEILDAGSDFPLPSGDGADAMLVLLSRRGYIKAQPVRRGSDLAGAEALASREDDFVRATFLASSSDRLLVLTERGNAHVLPISALPRGTRSSRGRRLTEFLELESGDRIVTVLPVERFADDRFLVTATRKGQVKRTALEEYANVRSGGIIGVGLAGDDGVIAALITGGESELLLATRRGQAIRFREEEIRPMGRTARGVKGIDLEPEDEVVAGDAARRDSELVAATAGGYGKRLSIDEFRTQGRAGKGLNLLPDRETTGDLVDLLAVFAGERVMWEAADGTLFATATGRIPSRSRRDPGVRILESLGGEQRVRAVHRVRTEPPESESASPSGARSRPGAATGDPDEEPAAGTEQREMELEE